MSATTPKKTPARKSTASKVAATRVGGPHIPPNAPKPQDHLRSAAEREADGDEMVSITWRGDEYTVPANGDDWPADAAIGFESGRPVSGTRALLGPQQWARVQRRNPKAKDIVEIFNLIAEAVGIDAGE